MSQSPLSNPPARHLRLLANLAPAAAVLFGLTTIWVAVSTVQTLIQLVTTSVAPSQQMVVVVLGFIVLPALSALLTGLITYRLAVEVPRTLRDWQGALAERTRVLHDR